MQLNVPKPPPFPYPKELKTVGDHIRKVRLDRGLWQCHVAELLGVCEGSVMQWENNISYPRTRFWPKIIEFLGYDPDHIEGNSLAIELRNYRRQHGLIRKELAQQIGVDPTTILWWERGREVKFNRSKRQLEAFFEKVGIQNVEIPFFDSSALGRRNYAKWREKQK